MKILKSEPNEKNIRLNRCYFLLADCRWWGRCDCGYSASFRASTEGLLQSVD